MLQHNSAMHSTLQCSSLNSGDGHYSARRAGIEPLHDHIATIPQQQVVPIPLPCECAPVVSQDITTIRECTNPARVTHTWYVLL